jgi:hypothetical protein
MQTRRLQQSALDSIQLLAWGEKPTLSHLLSPAQAQVRSPVRPALFY